MTAKRMRFVKWLKSLALIVTWMALGGLVVAAYDYINFRRAESAAMRSSFVRKAALSDLVLKDPTAGNYVKLAEAGVATEDFDCAMRAYASAAKIYASRGSTSFAYAAERLSQRYEVVAIPYAHLAANEAMDPSEDTRARLEPVAGCYIGAFIDHEDSIKGTYRDEYGTWRRDASAFNHLTGTHHALFFMYLGYGRKFPTKFAAHMKTNGAAAQIAFEPKNLDDVRNNGYLHDFAKSAKQSGIPIFLRFASEMNGDWVPYHGNPKLYIEKFQLVAKVMHEEAPNVAMVWCPFETPVSTINAYFPGDDAVDWVGLNIYSVPFWNNDKNQPAAWRNPADSLRYVYGEYAEKHPIMICEYAASHLSSLDHLDRTELARTKMAQLYTALPRIYPRVKAVCWLSMNAIKHAIPGRQSNDYSLLEEQSIRSRYEQLLKLEPYFLRRVPLGSRTEAKAIPEEIKNGQELKGRVALTAWVKLYDDHPTVIWRVNGDTKYQSTQPGPHRWVMDTKKLKPGPAVLDLIVYDDAGRPVATESRQVTIAR